MKASPSLDPRPSPVINTPWGVIASRVLLVGMMACSTYSIYQFIHFAIPAMNSSFLIVLGLLITFEAMLSHRQSKHTHDMDISLSMYYFVEWVVLVLFIKLFLLLRPGQPPLLEMLEVWRNDIYTLILDGETLIAVATAFFTWAMTLWYLKDLDEIESEESILVESTEGLPSNRYDIRKRIIARFLSIGFSMILITVVVNLDFKSLFQGTLSSHRSGSTNIILYFLFGLLLLSLTHYAVLRAGWAWERIPLDPHIIRNWFLYSLTALALVSLFAFVLPTNYSYGILSVLRYLINLIFTLLFLFFLTIISGLLSVVRFLYSLFKSSAPEVELPSMPSLPDIPESVEQASPASWIKLLQSILFWVVFIGIIVFALYQYLHQNRELMDRIRRIRGLRWLGEAFRWIRERLRGINQAAARMLSLGVKQLQNMLGIREREVFNYINLRRLSPRQKVLFYYLALVRRGSETGIKRDQSQTPYEYALSLKKSVIDVDEPIESMTGAFVEARYSKHDVKISQVNLVKQAWDRIRKVFHNMGRPRS